jgi:F0F1-type ATP synthase assembly protein I
MIVLFKRLPILFWKPKINEQIVPPDERKETSALEDDFKTLEERLMDNFRRLDNEALRAQNNFRWQQIILIVGSLLASTLGAIRAAMPETAPWPGVVEALIAAMLAAVAVIAKQTESQKKYFSNRLKAETLRGEYFLFLGRLGEYKDGASRVRNLIRRVAEIESGKKGE